eukprot:3375339-Rhodomonas_salina.4
MSGTEIGYAATSLVITNPSSPQVQKATTLSSYALATRYPESPEMHVRLLGSTAIPSVGFDRLARYPNGSHVSLPLFAAEGAISSAFVRQDNPIARAERWPVLTSRVFSPAVRCPVLSSRMLLRECYAKSGSDTANGAMLLHECYAKSGTEQASGTKRSLVLTWCMQNAIDFSVQVDTAMDYATALYLGTAIILRAGYKMFFTGIAYQPTRLLREPGTTKSPILR